MSTPLAAVAVVRLWCAALLALTTFVITSRLAIAQDLLHCFDAAGQRYRVSPNLLRAIAQVESAGNPHAINVNQGSRSVDVGLMQINSQHLPTLERHGIAPHALFDACTSIHIGAWVLAHAMAQLGSTWEAVGAYNAGFAPGNASLRLRYAERVRRALVHLEAQR